MTSEVEHLEVCPFCGGEANAEVKHSLISGVKDRHFPSCLNGECPAFIVDPYTTWGTKAEAIAAWSRRHTTSLSQRLEAARVALEPFALHIRDDVPDDMLIETVAWTAGQHRAALAALKTLRADEGEG